MNFIQKYKLYKKLINPGPTISTKDDITSTNGFTCIDWTYTDDNNTAYVIRSFKMDANKNVKRDYDFYSAFVYLNGKEITVFAGGRWARKLYDKAAAVMLTPIQQVTITARARVRVNKR